ncbi:hypothetical protein BAY61_22540 [Prauserella marina]|nr:hypothetical protein BAY61_22540 [Prauserella marina]
MTLRGKRTGDPEGAPVLCLHGWLDNCASFDALADRLPETDLLAIDLPGHGFSDPITSATCQYADYVAAVLELAHTLGWQRFRLIGHSLGGALASLIAGTHPGAVERLVLIDAIGPLPARPEDSVAALAGYLTEYLKGHRSPVYRTRAQAVKARVKLADILLSTAEVLVERDLREVEGGYTWRHDPRLKKSLPRGFTEEQVLAFLSAITAPSLLVRAERTALREDFYPRRFETVPGLRVVTLPGGHHLHVENPDQVAGVIRDFLGFSPGW